MHLSSEEKQCSCKILVLGSLLLLRPRTTAVTILQKHLDYFNLISVISVACMLCMVARYKPQGMLPTLSAVEKLLPFVN